MGVVDVVVGMYVVFIKFKIENSIVVIFLKFHSHIVTKKIKQKK